MPQETAALIIKVQQDGVAKAADSLDRLTGAGEKAEGVASSLASEFAKTDSAARRASTAAAGWTRQTEEMNRSAIAAAKSGKAVNSSLAEQQSALVSLLGKIDPVVGAYGRLDEMEKQLKGFGASGLLGGEDLAEYSAKIEQMRTQLEQAALASTAEGQAAAKAARESAAADQRAQTAKESFIASLKQQSDTMGMTTAELLEYKAAQLGVSAQVAPYIQKLNQQNGTIKAATLSAKQYAQAMRYLPMQITDVVTSLASGMPVWLVAIQQGGQIKDSFGGVGNAAKALLSFINPLTLGITALAVTAGALALAYKKGQGEMDAFNQAIITTGNYAGISASQLADMSKSISSNIGTTANAAKALTAALNTGAFSGDQLKMVAQAAVAMQDATGKSIDETISDFKKLEQDPVRASETLNDQYHYLTASVYEQIAALERQGNTQQAAAVAVSAYASAQQKAAAEVKQNLGALESAWDTVANAAKGAWDAMLDIGRTQTPADRVKEATAKVNNLQASLSGLESIDTSQGGMATAGVGNAKARFKEQLAAAQSELQSALADNQRDLNKAATNQTRQYFEEQAIQATKAINSTYDTVMTKAQQRKKELDAFEKNLQNGGILPDGVTADQIRQQISDKYKDPKTPKEKAVTDSAATRELLQLQEQHATLEAQLATTDKLSTSEQALVKFNQQIADLKSKSILTAEQKSILANEDALRGAYEQNAALAQRIQQREALQKLEERSAQLNESMASAYNGAGEQYQRQLNAYGKGDKEVERTESTASIYKEFQRYQEQLDKATPKSLLESDAYKQETANIKSQLDARLKQQSDSYAQLDALQGDWTNGATAAYQNYIDSAKNIAGQTKDAFTNAFSSMEDSLVSFVTTGKASFSSFATSVLNDMARIAIRSASSSALQSLFGLVGSAASSAAGGSASASTGFNTGAYNNLSLNAKGGVYDSPSLSAYSGRVVSKPTFFAFANGGGVMGEAGPEAILPLKRSSDGSLGVRAKGVGGAGVTLNAPITLNVDQRGNTNDQQQQNNDNLLKTLQRMVDSRINSALLNQQRDGGILRA
ncbi:Prophage tail length tape measure protein [Sodalis praecaptivus]|uniref:Prophage tail length tape measure protein n=1 Tax=Sodalis praecaptivus TaxID=1239307 RepID=W0HVV1_9GAMM|nr:phage tail tape measure protein [Sodalis praecaptivus]AHF77899.1 Prophage tail length tape measure protein [Sodalis praecaptivus]